MMMLWRVVAVYITLAQLQTSVRGGYCTRLVCTSERKRVCAYSTWRGCCAYKTVFVPVYRRVRYCCSGFKGRDCNTPICNPPCKNGGTCTSPGICTCPAGYKGPTCSGVAPCSHLSPCFPGICDNSCTCVSGFTGDTCDRVMEAPLVWKCEARLASLKVSDNPEERGMLLYELITDSSNPNSSKIDSIWSNQKGFNFLQISGTAQFEPEQLPPNPDYVKDARLGVTSAMATVDHTKINPTDGSRFTETNQYRCNATGSILTFWNCTVKDSTFNQLISNGDELLISLKFTSGGQRDLINPDTKQSYRTQLFQSDEVEKKLLYKFDLQKPNHCSTNRSPCSKHPLSVQEEITRSQVHITWDGWEDSLSGMYRYAWEVFRLEPYRLGELRELEPLKPLVINEWFESDGVPSISYIPPEPGMYSVILEASDLANNSLYSRRLFLFDNVSSVSINSAYPLFISSAVPGTNYSWMSHVGGNITARWAGHFENKVHNKGRFLNAVLPYPKQFTNLNREAGQNGRFTIKYVEFDDSSGSRTLEPIANAMGIVKFEVSFATGTPGGGRQQTLSDSWKDVNLKTELAISPDTNFKDGDFLTVWVRATDIMNSSRVENTTVGFDSSPPVLVRQELRKNVGTEERPYISTLNLTVYDEHSGIERVSWQISRDSTGEVKEKGDIDLTTYNVMQSDCTGDLAASCRCTPNGDCFNSDLQLNIDHCWLSVEKFKLDSESVTLAITATNKALLQTNTSLQIGDLTSFRGIGMYPSPRDVRVIREGFNTVRIQWLNARSCYNLTELWINYTGEAEKTKIHRLSRFFDLTGLSPERNYTAHLIAGYSGEMSDPVEFRFRTGPAPQALSAGGQAGVAIGVILFIVLVVAAVFLLHHFGVIALAMGRRKERAVSYKAATRPSRRTPGGFVDDDIYVVGGDEFDIPIGVQTSSERLVLEDLITEGKFARIYKAKLVRSETENLTVVAKMIRDDNEEDRQLMRGKILFNVHEVGEHVNVLHMIAAVTDNDAWGPVMVLEYCEMGSLRSWLVKQKKQVNDDVIERMFQFGSGIVKGMAYLSNLGIIHRRLAARNILLTFLLEVKITGFGPTIMAEGEPGDKPEDDRRERIPIRWVAPECFKSNKDANEKSDVWSFGVVLWEIFSLGDSPYPTLKTHEIPSKVKSGHRMERPEYCDDFNYRLMQACWETKASQRPTFNDLEASYLDFMTGGNTHADYSNSYSYGR